MPATDSSSAPFDRSILSRRRDQTPFPPVDHRHHAHANSPDLQINALQRHAADLLLDLLPDSNPVTPEILSVTWTRHLLDSFLICLEEFRAVLFGCKAAAAAHPLLDRLVANFFDRVVKALDLCNALHDGLDLIRQWRKHLTITAATLTSPDPAALLGEGQILWPREQGRPWARPPPLE